MMKCVMCKYYDNPFCGNIDVLKGLQANAVNLPDWVKPRIVTHFVPPKTFYCSKYEVEK
jgi:hypothetical protein